MRATEYGYSIESEQDSIVSANVEALHEWIDANIAEEEVANELREYIVGMDPESDSNVHGYLDTFGVYIERYDLFWQEREYRSLLKAGGESA